MQSSKIFTALNVSSAILTFGVQMLVSFFLSSYLVATVGEVANGFTQLANNFVTYASLITVAFNSMGSRFISASYHRGEKGDSRAYYSTLVVVNAVLCLLFLPIAVYVVVNLGIIVDMGDADLLDVQLLFSFVFANFGVSLFVSLFCSAMFVTNKVYIQNAINLIRSILNALLLVAAYSLFETHVNYVSFIALFLTLVSVPVCYRFKCLLVPELKFSFSSFSGMLLKRLTSSGVWNSINQCGNVLTTGLDLLFANWFVGASPMGVLSVAKIIPNAIAGLATTLNGNFEPELVIVYAREGCLGLANRLRSDMRLSNLIVSVPIGVFCALAPGFYSLWMPSLDSGQLALLSFLSIINFIPWAGPQVLYNAFTVMNRLRVNSVSFFVGSVVNVVVVLFLLQYTDLGVLAIAGVSGIVSIVRNLFVIAPYVSHMLGLPWYSFYKEMGISAASCFLSYGISLLFSWVFGAGTWALLALSILLSCVVSWVALFFATISRSDRNRLRQLLKRRV